MNTIFDHGLDFGLGLSPDNDQSRYPVYFRVDSDALHSPALPAKKRARRSGPTEFRVAILERSDPDGPGSVGRRFR